MISRFVMRFLPIALLVLAASFAMQAKAGSIALDGGFESAAVNCTSGVYSGSLGDGWTATEGLIAVCNSSDFSGVPHSGSQMAYLDWSNTVNTVSQTLTTTVGQSYLISYWVADNVPDTFSVSFGSQVLFDGTAPTNGVDVASDYVNDTYTATATSSSTILSFTGQWLEIEGGNGTILDDVSVTAVSSSVPEPATLGFTALGFLALFSLRSIYGKLQVRSTAKAVVKARRNRPR
jgi:hypothetical protein